jgi:hypothetical protein
MPLLPTLLRLLSTTRHAVFAEDVVYQLRDDHPHLTCGEVDDALRVLKVAGLVVEQKSAVNFDSRWRLADGVIDRATLAGLGVLALSAANGEV